MNIKLVFGIFLPIAITLFLIFLNNLDIGFSSEKKTENSVNFESLFTNTSWPMQNVHIQTITLTNDFFLPRRLELPRIVACLNDREWVIDRDNLQIKYSEGVSEGYYDSPIFYDYNYYSRQSIEIPAKSEKQVRILVEPKYVYYGDINNYREYDEILLVELKSGKGYYCKGLESSDLANAIHIIIKK